MKDTKIGVLLSGCGVEDGSEIQEAVLALLALDRAGVEAVCLAPDRDQAGVVDHVTGEAVPETRNMLVESARICRGKIRKLSGVSADDLDAVLLPGGFGAAKNLSTFAERGADCEVDPDVRRLLVDLHTAGKPIAALCIAPAVLAAVFGADHAPEITIGTDAGVAGTLERMGARHRHAAPTEVVVDRVNRLVTTPCYMSATRIGEISDGARGAVRELLKLVEAARTPA